MYFLKQFNICIQQGGIQLIKSDIKYIYNVIYYKDLLYISNKYCSFELSKNVSRFPQKKVKAAMFSTLIIRNVF